MPHARGERIELASLMLASGTGIFEVFRALGHSSIAITASTYGHVTAAMQAEAAARLDAHNFGA